MVSGMSSRLASPLSSWSVNSRSRVSRAIAIGLPIRTRSPVSSLVSIGTDRPMTSASRVDAEPEQALALAGEHVDGLAVQLDLLPAAFAQPCIPARVHGPPPSSGKP